MSAACQHLDPRLVVYDCGDRWPEFLWKEKQVLLQQDDVGAIKGKVDVPPLSKVAQARPQWSVVLVGPTFPGEVQLRLLESHPKVHLLGYRSPAQLPGYFSHPRPPRPGP